MSKNINNMEGLSERRCSEMYGSLDCRGCVFYQKMRRLRSDLNKFKEDIDFIRNDGKIIYVTDYTEINAYISPAVSIHDYLYGLTHPNEIDIKGQRIRRWFRLRELFFNDARRTLILPPHMEELRRDITYYMQRAVGDSYNMEAMINDYKMGFGEEGRYLMAKEMIGDVGKKKYIKQYEEETVSDFFDSYALYVAALTYDNKYIFNEGIDGLERLSLLLNKGNLTDLTKSEWIGFYGLNEDIYEKIGRVGINNQYEKIKNVSDEISKIRRKRLLSNVTDAMAIVYMDGMNKVLQESNENVRLQLVTSALSLFTVCDKYDNLQRGYVNAYIRHPKFLPLLMNDSDHFFNEETSFDYVIIVGAIDAYIDKYENAIIDKNPEDVIHDLEEKLRAQISDAWMKLENKMFLREVSLMEKHDMSDLKRKIIKKNHSSQDEKKNAINLLQYVNDNRNAFNLYIRHSYYRVFDQLVMFYLQSLMRYNEVSQYKFKVYCFGGIEDNDVIRILWHSEGIRSIVEFRDPILIKLIKSKKRHHFDLVSLMDDKSGEYPSVENEYERSLIKALCMAAGKQWQLVEVICRYAISINEENSSEAYYLLSLTQRRQAFEKLNDIDEATARVLFENAVKSLDKAKVMKVEKDYRFIYAEFSMFLERIVLFGSVDVSIKYDNDPVYEFISVLEEVKKRQRSEYNEHLEYRAYQLLITFYFMLFLGMCGGGIVSDNKKREVSGWYVAIKKHSEDDVPYKPLSTSINIIINACPLVLFPEKLSRSQCISYFDNIYMACDGLSEDGFYRIIVHELKLKLYNEMRKKYSLRENEVARWPRMKEGYRKKGQKK
jgi:hypothetical protein